jgi:hypothetical protein
MPLVMHVTHRRLCNDEFISCRLGFFQQRRGDFQVVHRTERLLPDIFSLFFFSRPASISQ